MGIIVSIPQIEGLRTVLPLSSTTCSTSYAFDSAQTSDFAVSTRNFDNSNIESTLVVTVAAAQTGEVPSADGTDVIWVRPSDFTETVTTYLSTATVTSTISSTKLITATAKVVASNCPTTTATTSDTVKLTALTKVYTSGTVGMPAHSSPPPVSSDYGIPSSSGLPENGAHVIETYISILSNPRADISSGYGTSSYSRLPGSGALSPQSSLSRFVTRSTKSRSSTSVSGSEASTLRSVIAAISNKHPPVSKKPPVATVRYTHPTRATSVSQLDRGSLTVRGHGVAYGEADYTLSSKGPIGPIDWHHTTTLTKTEDVTTTTVYTSAITNHTSTTTITTLPTRCLTSRTSSSSPTFSTSCTSAIPNPDPPANDTCAEDGLLEYSNTLQPPDTLEDCAAACLADPSCLSFTFIPSESTCYTSLYPLADSAYAGVQQYHIYNYDRDCYSCSSL
ncbi:hypothetical protein HO173_002352 [Letharia columbiana]|uniref:Apple domain-containing protein n=1 Tax=Letharia columbiana TaxID=112416 RepID=A0A8H6G3L1_9LECA|nr:uncharacterized protein HO173_002352 [Letharia columbiana]KAF6239806.1 hypothetical protein HO173_002352 [Letharia columbiana]